MIHCSGVTAVHGSCVTTDRGETLKLIGNYHPEIGSSVWTDGVIAYGDRPIVGGQQNSFARYAGYLFSNGSAINYLDDYFTEKKYCARYDNSYVVTGSNHVWVLGIDDVKITGINTTDILDVRNKKQRTIEISVPKESEVRDACVDDNGNLHMIVLTVENSEETIRIYQNDSLVLSKKNIKTITWPDEKTDKVEMIAWYAHIEKDGSYNVLSAYTESKMHKAKIGRDIPYTGIIKDEKDYQKYTGKTWDNKIVQVYDFWGFFYDKKVVAEKGLTITEIEGSQYALNLRQIDEMIKSGEMKPEDIYGDWYTNAQHGGKGPLYGITRDDVDSSYNTTSNGNVPLFPTLKEAIFDYRNYHQFKIINDNNGKEDEVYSVEAYQDIRRVYPTVTPDEIKYCSDNDPNNTDIRVIVNPPGNFWSVGLALDPDIWGEQDPWNGYFDDSSMGIKSFTVGYYVDTFPGNYKREQQHLFVAAYHTERPSTAPIKSDPKFDKKSKPFTIPVGDSEIKFGAIEPVKPVEIINDIENLNGYLKSGSDDKHDSKRMIGQCFTSNGQIIGIQFKAEDTWIADAFRPKNSKSKNSLILTGAGLKVGETGEMVNESFSSLHNMRVNHYRPINKYLSKD